MKYPRTARIFRGQLDAAPFAGVLFLVLLFVLLCSLVYTPGVRIELPVASRLSAPNRPTVQVAVDSKGLYFYENQMIEADTLRARLSARAKASPEPLVLLVRADKAVTLEIWNRLVVIAREAGIYEVWQATLPRLFDDPRASRTNAPPP
jgi:biopolymer transport protein ExbD